MEAYLTLAKLRSEGILSVVANDYIATMNSIYPYLMGGVKVCVRESDVEKAKRILDLSRQNITADIDKKNQETSYDVNCPSCGSGDVNRKRFDKFAVFTALMAIAGIMNLVAGPKAFILPFTKHKWVCRSCGYQWRTDKKTVLNKRLTDIAES